MECFKGGELREETRGLHRLKAASESRTGVKERGTKGGAQRDYMGECRNERGEAIRKKREPRSGDRTTTKSDRRGRLSQRSELSGDVKASRADDKDGRAV